MTRAAAEAAQMIRTGSLPSYAIRHAARWHGKTTAEVCRELREASAARRAARKAQETEREEQWWDK